MNQRSMLLEESGLNIRALKNVTLHHYFGITSSRRHLERLPVEDYTSCLIVADELFEQDLMHSDSHNITTLLLMRNMQSKRHPSARLGNLHTRCPMLCEILDARTQGSICSSDELNNTSDFVRSNEMVSRVLAMVSEDRTVNAILDELLGGQGCSLELKPSAEYVHSSESLTFLELSARAQEHDNDILVGFQTIQEGSALAAGTVLNPRDKFIRCNWEHMRLVVLTGSPLHPHLHETQLMNANQKHAGIYIAENSEELKPPNEGSCSHDPSCSHTSLAHFSTGVHVL